MTECWKCGEKIPDDSVTDICENCQVEEWEKEDKKDENIFYCSICGNKLEPYEFEICDNCKEELKREREDRILNDMCSILHTDGFPPDAGDFI